MTYSLFDVVVLVDDIADENLIRGDIGTIVYIYEAPCEAYEVEFTNPRGETLAQIALTPKQIKKQVAGAP